MFVTGETFGGLEKAPRGKRETEEAGEKGWVLKVMEGWGRASLSNRTSQRERKVGEDSFWVQRMRTEAGGLILSIKREVKLCPVII